MNSTKSLFDEILGNYQAREKKLKQDADQHDKLLKEKTRAREKELADIAAKLKPKHAALDVMTADYHTLEISLIAKAIAGSADTAAIGERAKIGQAALAEILSAKEREQKARIDAAEKLTDAAKLIRTLRAEIYRLEFEDVAAREAIYRYQAYPAQMQVEKLLAEVDTLRAGIGAVQGGQSKAQYDLNRAKHNAQLCAGRFALEGMSWTNLDAQGLRDIRLDPRLPDEYLGELEKIIQEVGDRPDQRTDLFLSSGLQRGSGRNELTFRQTIVEGEFLTTVKAASHRPREK